MKQLVDDARLGVIKSWIAWSRQQVLEEFGGRNPCSDSRDSNRAGKEVESGRAKGFGEGGGSRDKGTKGGQRNEPLLEPTMCQVVS